MKKILLVLVSIFAAVSLVGCGQQETKKVDFSSKYDKDANIVKFENYEKQNGLDKQSLKEKKPADYGAKEGWGRDEYEFYYFTDSSKLKEAKQTLSKQGKLITGKDYIIVVYKTAKEDTVKILNNYR